MTSVTCTGHFSSRLYILSIIIYSRKVNSRSIWHKLVHNRFIHCIIKAARCYTAKLKEQIINSPRSIYYPETRYDHIVYFRSENCGKFSPANRRHHNWEPIHQSSMLRVTIYVIGQCA